MLNASPEKQLAKKPPKEITYMIEQISGSLEKKADYEQLKAEADAAAEDNSLFLHQRRQINAEIKTYTELEAEATGKKVEPEVQTTKSKNAAIRKKADKKRKEEEEERERQKMMLSNKKRKLLKRIDYGANKRDAEAETLRKKKRKIEKAKAAANAV